MRRTAALLLRHPTWHVAITALVVAALGVVVRSFNAVTRTDADVVAWAARERTPFIVDLARAVTNLGNGSVIAVLLSVVLAGLVARGRLRPRVATVPLISLAFGVVVSAVGKMIVGRPRPPVALHEVVERTSGFPSGHSTQSAAGWLALALVLTFAGSSSSRTSRWALPLALVVVGVVGLSRVVLSVHSPTDVLAGWALGAACAFASVAALHGTSGTTSGTQRPSERLPPAASASGRSHPGPLADGH
jgi:undecaprenyl-diphosphatase